jgi:hypothetical protein
MRFTTRLYARELRTVEVIHLLTNVGPGLSLALSNIGGAGREILEIQEGDSVNAANELGFGRGGGSHVIGRGHR